VAVVPIRLRSHCESRKSVSTVLKLDRAVKRESNDDNHEDVPR
jgi:hypothetical protein